MVEKVFLLLSGGLQGGSYCGEILLWETPRRSCLPGVGLAGSPQQTWTSWEGWAPAAGQAACPATVPRARDGSAGTGCSPRARGRSTGLFLVSAECRVASLGTHTAALLLERCHFGLI